MSQEKTSQEPSHLTHQTEMNRESLHENTNPKGAEERVPILKRNIDEIGTTITELLLRLLQLK